MTAAHRLLTVGFVVASKRGPTWIDETIRAVEGCGLVAVAGVAVVEEPPRPRGQRFGRGLLDLYRRVDDRVFGRPDDPGRMIRIAGASRMEGPGGAPPDATAAPDLVIRLDGRSGPLDVWPAPSKGTWVLEHGVGLPASVRRQAFDLPPGGPEMLLGQTVTISRLVTGPDGARRILGEVVSRADPLSMRRGAVGHQRKLPGLVLRAVTAASEGHEGQEIGADPEPSDTRGIGSAVIAVRLAGIAVGYGRRLIDRTLAPTRWSVAVSLRGRDPRGPGATDFRFLRAPEGVEWTDPFPVRTPEADLVFVEEFDLKAWRGRLVAVELDGSQRGWHTATTVLDLPTHLSYPFVFHWAGDWYLMPEQAATGRLEVYIAQRFPYTWRWHSTALEAAASDATIAEIGGRWWLFAAMAVEGGVAMDDLHLFHADTPLGPWVPHRGNPVVSDVRTARPAGRLYERGGSWYRVAQDGAISYGHSIAIIRIDRIDLDGYSETVVDVIRPDWAPGLVATHTINTDKGLTVIDALSRVPRLRPRIPRTPRLRQRH